MAAEGGIVDQLVVQLELDAKQYEKGQKKVDQLVGKTEKKLDDNDKKAKKRHAEGKKRDAESLKGVKQLTEGLGKLAFTVGAVLGIGGGAAGILGAIVSLTGMEVGLRRAAVATGLSNRELQAYGNTARRLGADANSGAAAIANLAREQKEFHLTGNAPTLSAFSRIGVNANDQTPIQDILEQAQKIYRQAAPAQQTNMEAQLQAGGVDPDLIVMIKSQKDASEAYTKSLSEATTENKSAFDAVSDAMATLQASATSAATSLVTILKPAIDWFANWSSQGAQKLSEFNDKMIAAGGGVDGFSAALKTEAPQLATVVDELGKAFSGLGEVVDVVWFGFKELGRAGEALFDWINSKLAAFGVGAGKNGQPSDKHPLTTAVGQVGDALKWAWSGMVADARHDAGESAVQLTPNAQKRLAAGATGGATGGAPAPLKLSGTQQEQSQQIMSQLVSTYGLTPAQAAAYTANVMRESGGDPSAFNAKGGGQGAQGIAQWRGARVDAFRKRYGVDPRGGTLEQQIEFSMTDPYERHLINKSLAGGGSAQQLGENFSRIYEAHGNTAEDRTRGALAGQLAGNAAQGQDASLSAGESVVHINGPVTVVANDPKELVEGLQRQSGVQSYNSSVK